MSGGEEGSGEENQSDQAELGRCGPWRTCEQVFDVLRVEQWESLAKFLGIDLLELLKMEARRTLSAVENRCGRVYSAVGGRNTGITSVRAILLGTSRPTEQGSETKQTDSEERTGPLSRDNLAALDAWTMVDSGEGRASSSLV